MSDSIKEYIKSLPSDRKEAVTLIFNILSEKLPKGFESGIANGMITFYVPYSVYPAGYHCKPKQPLPFIALASQKNGISIYHMGLYADPVLTKWFKEEYIKSNSGKLDMGKSCIRFKDSSKIPFQLLGKLATKITVKKWIATYESNFRK
jgi:hypothetical protein